MNEKNAQAKEAAFETYNSKATLLNNPEKNNEDYASREAEIARNIKEGPLNDKKEREFEQHYGARLPKDTAAEEALKEQIQKILEKDEATEEPQKTSQPQKTSGSKAGLFKRIGTAATALFFSSLMGAKANTNETDSLKKGTSIEKHVSTPSSSPLEGVKQITPVYEQKIVGDVTMEGRYIIPSSDTTKQYEMLVLSGNETDNNKIEKILSTISKLGYKPANGDMLKFLYRENGNNLVKASRGSIIAMGEVIGTPDDTKNSSQVKAEVINDEGSLKVTDLKPTLSSFPTLNQLGQINKYDDLESIQYGDYRILVYKAK